MSSQTQSASETTKRCHHPRSTATITPSSSSVRRILHLKNSVFDLSKAADKKSSSKKKKKKSEHFQCVKIKGDGRCMFRALALGLAHLSKHNMTSSEETKEAMRSSTVFEQMCRDEEKRKGHSEASMSIKYGDPDGIEGYCRRIQKEDFWGGETELLVLAKLIRRPIMVYLPAHMAKNAASGSGYVCIQTYGEEYASKMNKKTGKVTERAPVRLLYNGQTHYDLLI